MVAIELLLYDAQDAYTLATAPSDGTLNIRRDGAVAIHDEQAFIELCLSAWRAYQAGRM